MHILPFRSGARGRIVVGVAACAEGPRGSRSVPGVVACGGVAVEKDCGLFGVVFDDGLAVAQSSGCDSGWHVLDELASCAVAGLP